MMKVSEALDALRPLLAQRRALDSLHGILEAAHQAEAAMPHVAQKLQQAEKEAGDKLKILAEKEAQAISAADDASKRASQAEAQAAEFVARFETDCKAKEQAATAAHDALLARHATETASALAAHANQEAQAKRRVEAALLRLKETNEAVAEAEQKLTATEGRLADLRAKLA
jgi:hypothetical protein